MSTKTRFQNEAKGNSEMASFMSNLNKKTQAFKLS